MKRCPKCGRLPKLKIAHPAKKNHSIVRYAYMCIQRDHICAGDYCRTIREAIIDWDLVVLRDECKIIKEGG